MQAGFSDVMQLADDGYDRAFASAMARSFWLTMYGEGTAQKNLPPA